MRTLLKQFRYLADDGLAKKMETLLEKPENLNEQELLEKEFGELLETTLRLEYELKAVLTRE